MTQAQPAPRRFGRRLLRACGGCLGILLLLLALGFAWLTEPVDRSPLLGSAVATQTEALLESQARKTAARGLERGPLRVGWASADITPPLGTPTYGYGARRGQGVTAIADPVYAHALALSVGDGPPLVFLTADICLWVSDVSSRIATEVADLAPRERIYFGATHTHSGPGGYADGPAASFTQGERRSDAVDRLVSSSMRAIRDAIADLAPGAYRELSAPVPEHVRNRIRKGVPLDDELVLREFVKSDGRRCAWVSYSAHATAIGSRPLICSGDYPGALVRTLKERGYDAALFFASETGQAGPRMSGEARHPVDADKAWRLGEALAERVLDLSRGSNAPARSAAVLAVFRARVVLPPFRFKALGRILDPGVAAWLVGCDAPVATVHAVRLGETVSVGHSFEFSAVIGRELKARARERGRRLLLTSFNGDHNLYVVPDADYDRGYEGGMTLFGPGLGSYLSAITEQVAARLFDLDPQAIEPFDLSGNGTE